MNRRNVLVLGMAYDGLIYVNGHWAWFPKPWRVLGGDGE